MPAAVAGCGGAGRDGHGAGDRRRWMDEMTMDEASESALSFAVWFAGARAQWRVPAWQRPVAKVDDEENGIELG